MSKTTDNDVNVRLIEKINQVEENYEQKFSNTQKYYHENIRAVKPYLYSIYCYSHDESNRLGRFSAMPKCNTFPAKKTHRGYR